MAADNWEQCFALILKNEGGFEDDPHDPGNRMPDGRAGCTNFGVIQANWEDFVGHQVTHEDMRALTINDVNPFYRKRYWDTIKGDDLPMGVDYAVFDFEINSGGRAAKALQSLLGVTVDGQIGPTTVAAAQAADASSVIAGICETRLNYLKTLSDWDRYGNGWANRIERVQDIATKMIG